LGLIFASLRAEKVNKFVKVATVEGVFMLSIVSGRIPGGLRDESGDGEMVES
jgi:hypothetical protein